MSGGSAMAATADECRWEAEQSAQKALLEQDGYVVSTHILDPDKPGEWKVLREAEENNWPVANLGPCRDTRLQVFLVAKRPALQGRVTQERELPPDPTPPPRTPRAGAGPPVSPSAPASRNTDVDLACRGTYTECYGRRPLPGYTSSAGPPRGPGGRPATIAGGPTPGMPSAAPQPVPEGPRRTEAVCDLRELAALVAQRYGTRAPVARLTIVNSDRPVYVVLLAGMEFELAQANSAAGALIAFENVQALDVYRLAVMDALQGLPAGSELILVGHSMGGMTAQNMVANLVHRWRFRVVQVVSYGAPITAERETTTNYLHVRATDEPLQALDRKFNLGGDTSNRIVRCHPGRGFPFEAPDGSHHVYDKPESGLGSLPVPSFQGLGPSSAPASAVRTACYEIDPASLVEVPAPDWLTRLLAPRTAVDTRSPPPHNPEWGLAGSDYNCFWVSLAQDNDWREDRAAWAHCSARPIFSREVSQVLERTYGHLTINDGHGPSSTAAQNRQRKGIPVEIHNREQLEKTLSAADSQALLFVRHPGGGHVINVRRQQGRLDYWDAQGGFDGRMWTWQPLNTYVYRTR